ncbi:hypothetical protein H70357_13900 [Paenibacillus sp. FSL H7-0357]|uniref:serine/threonine protein kinase n=1 Tax=Paenibacillus sp. FSL H7-0357 TaxID=1536774 RepID=UPI0004F7439C|nr:protein kinase [Paenibacillus sp. FSL H7-0357]AIQ17630.1 hypothetical protein H70357_13900 [Paenibacillus sp. FSL H7-0357]
MFKYLKSFLQAWADYPLEKGSSIGKRYRIIAQIGVGSYGITYRCRDEQEQQIVAVKQAKPSKKGIGQKMLAWEREVISQLEHPFIPACRDYFSENRSYWLVTDYVEGKTLEDLIFADSRTFGEQDTVKWTLELMERVQYVHSKGFVHLDIRIPNVIMRGEDLYLIDFGLAAPIGGNDTAARQQTQTGFNSVTPSKPATIQGDLFDIGHLMLFMLYSRFNPTSGAAEGNWMEELELSPQLELILIRLLGEGVPYQSTSEFVSELSASLPGLKS